MRDRSLPEKSTLHPACLMAGLLTVLLASLVFPTSLLALSAQEIMQKVNDRDDGNNQISNLEMTLIDRDGGKLLRSMRSFRKDYGRDTRQILFFLSPPDKKNSAFLTYDYDAPGKDDDQWMYLPELKRPSALPQVTRAAASWARISTMPT